MSSLDNWTCQHSTLQSIEYSFHMRSYNCDVGIARLPIILHFAHIDSSYQETCSFVTGHLWVWKSLKAPLLRALLCGANNRFCLNFIPIQILSLLRWGIFSSEFPKMGFHVSPAAGLTNIGTFINLVSLIKRHNDKLAWKRISAKKTFRQKCVFCQWRQGMRISFLHLCIFSFWLQPPSPLTSKCKMFKMSKWISAAQSTR